MKNLLVFTENEQIPTIVGTDANAHHTIWGSSDINPRGEDLLAYCASANLNFCNVGNKPTFRTKTRKEILNLTLVNRCTWNRVVGWHVSNVPSFSDHMYIRFQVKSRFQKQAKMFRNVRRTCWNKYVNELEQKLSEQALRPVPVPSSKKDIDVLANKVHSAITKSYEAACPLRSRFLRKITFGGIRSLQAFEKRLAELGGKPLKQNKKNTGRCKSLPYLISKKLSEKRSAIHGIAL